MRQILKISWDFCKTRKNMGKSLFLHLLSMVFSNFSFKFYFKIYCTEFPNVLNVVQEKDTSKD